jgi:hypothetical protein
VYLPCVLCYVSGVLYFISILLGAVYDSCVLFSAVLLRTVSSVDLES